MALCTNVTILLLVACLSNQLMASSCQRGNGRKGRGLDWAKDRDRPGQREGRHPRSVSPQPIKGKMVTKDKSQCTWAATGEDLFVLSVTCRKDDRIFSCEYVARPTSCPQYRANVQLFWKQIARALKKQKKLCQDGGALVRTGVCRQAPREAHFRLSQRKDASPSSPPPAAPTAVKSCQPENRKLAEEYCNTSWMSFCTFFFTMVQNGDC